MSVTAGVGAVLNRRAAVRVPATSANLGPGYDCGGLALTLYDELAAELLPGGELVVEVAGEGTDTVPRDRSHLVVRSLARGLAEAGVGPSGLRLSCKNSIPHGRGLGSSSAAIVGGLALARGLLPNGPEVLPDERVLAIAAAIEGHPDNVAPVVLGGFTIAWTDHVGCGRAIRLDPHPDLEPVVAIPKIPLPTEQARQLLPAVVPHADAAANAARAALLTEAMTRRPDLLLTATRDWLHQDYRRHAYPKSHALMSALRERGIPAMISGAGPTVIALGVRGSSWSGADVAKAIDSLAHGSPDVLAPDDFVARRLEVDPQGVVDVAS